MNHNIGNMIADKVIGSREAELMEIISIISEISASYSRGDVASVTNKKTRKIIDYILTTEFDKSLFTSLFVYLSSIGGRNSDNCIECKKEDLPLLVSYRKKCGLENRVYFKLSWFVPLSERI